MTHADHLPTTSSGEPRAGWQVAQAPAEAVETANSQAREVKYGFHWAISLALVCELCRN